MISLAAVWIVPGSFGFGSLVLAAIAIIAPSFAALIAIAKPMPLEPPVIKIFFPARLIYLPFLAASFIKAS